LNGKLESVQVLDGDTIVVSPRQYAVTVLGETQNPYVFEVRQATVPATEVLALSAPKPSATHLSVVRNTGVELKSDYYKLIDAAKVTVNSGDVVTVTADKYPTTILGPACASHAVFQRRHVQLATVPPVHPGAPKADTGDRTSQPGNVGFDSAVFDQRRSGSAQN
jgi:hypothetical protein